MKRSDDLMTATFPMPQSGAAFSLAQACCESMPGLVFYLDDQLNVVYANRSARYTFREVTSFEQTRSAATLFPLQTDEKWQIALTQARLTGSYVFQTTFPAGAEMDRVSVMVKSVEHQQRTYYILMAHALKEQGETHHAPPTILKAIAARSEKRFQSLYERFPVSLQFCDTQNILCDVNHHWLQTMGYQRDQVLGVSWMDFLTASSKARVEADVLPLLASGQHIEDVELEFVSASGEVLVMLYAASTPGEGNNIETMAVLTDITAQKRTEAKLERSMQQAEVANMSKSAFLAHMSHELRTPLNSVLGYAQILLQEDLGTKQRRGVETIHRSGEHLLMLINDVLDLSRIEVGQMELNEGDFNLRELLQHTCDITRIKAEQKSLSVLMTLSPDMPVFIHGDDRRIRQVLLNLMNNAIKFTEEGGVRLVGSLGEDGQTLQFCVQDTGVGIPEDRLEAIFEPFHQAHEHKARLQQQGVGLGLAITSRLLEMMGGSIRVESVPGQGTSFDVEIPYKSAAVHAMRRQKRVGYEGERRTILVVDDRWENRRVLTRILEPLGFILKEASHGLEALEVAKHTPPDLVLMDLVMPELDGFEATRRLKASPEGSQVPVIALSASAFEKDRQKSLGAGCDAFLPKPIQIEPLLAKIEQHLTLSWSYAGGDPAQDTSTEDTPKEALRVPAAEELQLLLHSAQTGQIIAFRRELDRLRTLDQAQQYKALWAQLEELSTHFRMDDISQLLQTLSS